MLRLTFAVYAVACAAIAAPAIAAAPDPGQWESKTLRAKGKISAKVWFTVDDAGQLDASVGYETGRCKPGPTSGTFFEHFHPAPVAVRSGRFTINAPHTTRHDDGVVSKITRLRVTGRFAGPRTASGTIELVVTTAHLTCRIPRKAWTAKLTRAGVPG